MVKRSAGMLVRTLLVFAVLFFAASARAQEEWEPIGDESFEAIAGIEDGSLLLIQYPGAILRSTDTGATWSEVYRGNTRLMGIGRAQHVPTEIVAYGDSGYALLSLDSGRTWGKDEGRIADDAGGMKDEGRGEFLHPSSFIPHPLSSGPLPSGTNAAQFADSQWFAVGEPGLIEVWDTALHGWREMHRAPFVEQRGVGLAPSPTMEAPTYAPIIDFHTPAYGAIAVGNRIFFTYDSGVTWKRTFVPDTSSISSLWLSDTFALAGMMDGRLYYITHSGDGFVRCDSILYQSGLQNWEPPPQEKPIVQIGWKDATNGELFVLTDSMLYSLSSDLHSSSSYNLPLRTGERAAGASFPNQYVGFLLTDSTKRIDTLTADGRDTTFVRDTSYIYRTLDGGATWTLALNNIPSLSKMFFVSVKRGFACGANGHIMVTNDSGSTWSRGWAISKQDLHDIRFVNDSVGYAVGDSGTVLQTISAGRLWRFVPPEPLFMHPSDRYACIAFPNGHTVFVISGDRGYRSTIKVPLGIRMNRRRQQRNTLSVTARPDPVSGPVTFDVRIAGSPQYGELPELKVCDMSGKSLYEASGFKTISTSEWSVDADLSFLQPGPYTAIATYGGQEALTKFLVQH
jgi:photosystem II stability/assembly factor-like uncharacterized protein